MVTHKQRSLSFTPQHRNHSYVARFGEGLFARSISGLDIGWNQEFDGVRPADDTVKIWLEYAQYCVHGGEAFLRHNRWLWEPPLENVYEKVRIR